MGLDIAPFVTSIIANIDPTKNPYPTFEDLASSVFYPATSPHFRANCYVCIVIFFVAAALVLTGLLLRISQGRFWLLHRIHGSLLMPNASVCYGVFALAYLSLGILNLFTGIAIADGSPYPDYYLVLQGLLPGFLWLGIFTEVWATLGSIAYRHRSSYRITSSASQWFIALIPILVVSVITVAQAILLALAQRDFNQSLVYYSSIMENFFTWSLAWTPDKGLDLVNLTKVLPLGSVLADSLESYAKFAAIEFYIVAGVFFLTMLLYVVSTFHEVSRLRRQARSFRGKRPLPDDARTSGALDAGAHDLEKELDSEWFSGVGRQAALIDWAATNRAWTGRFIVLMMLDNIGLSLWYALSPVTFPTASARFQLILLVSSYINGVLQACVSLLILFRSLDGSAPSTRKMAKLLPFLPLPPAVGLQGGTSTVFHLGVDVKSTITPSPRLPLNLNKEDFGEF